MVISLLETGWQPMTVFTMSLWTRNPMPWLCLSSLPLKYNLWPSSMDVSPKFFHCTSQRPKTFQWYLLISYDNSSNLPAIRKVILTFQVPMVILYLTSTLIVVTPVAYFSPPSWCATEGGVLVDLVTTDPVWVAVSWAKKAWFGFEVPSSRWATGQG